MKQHFQAWYAEEVQKQIASGTAISDVKIDTRTSILTPNRANCLIGTLDFLSQKPEIVINGFKRLELLIHLKLMNSRTLAVTRLSKVVSVLCSQKTLHTDIALQNASCYHFVATGN